MTERDDAELLDTLGRVFEVIDPPPEHVIASARDVFVWQSLDAELAELVYDSKADDSAPVRGADATREVTFRAPGIEVDVMVVSELHRSLVGQVVPAQEMDIELMHSAGTATTRTDALGRFAFDRVAPGPIKLVVVTASGMRVQTEGLVI
jgi:hypothetical protein